MTERDMCRHTMMSTYTVGTEIDPHESPFQVRAIDHHRALDAAEKRVRSYVTAGLYGDYDDQPTGVVRIDVRLSGDLDAIPEHRDIDLT